MYSILKTLCELPGPGGREESVHRFLLDRWRHQAAEVHITRVGNLVAKIGGRGPRLLLLGHGDEIGFAVKHISADGFLFFSTNQREGSGYPDLRGVYAIPTGQPALVIGRDTQVAGVFATLTGHILTPQQRQKYPLDWNDLWVDVFMGSRAEVEAAGIHIGDKIIWNPATTQHGKLITGKAMDNRVALALLDELLRRIEPERLQFEVFFGSTIQEESGLYGANSINREIGAEYGIALDTGLSGDVPGVDERDVSTRLGAGPILIHKDLYNYHFDLNNHIRDTAQAATIPLQHAVYSIYGTDSGALIREGVAAAALVVPCRYTHSPFETVHEADLEKTVSLLLEILYRPLAQG